MEISLKTKNTSQIADRTTGAILTPLIAFSVPIMLTNILQLLFNAADIIVVGQFADANAVAAVGSTTVIINLLINLFSGIAIGATVVLSTEIGLKRSDTSTTVHTTYALGIIFGIASALIGIFIAKPLLHLLGTPDEILDQASLYLMIYFLGQPGFMIYTFARAILISTGETKAPLIYLTISGIVNVVLNLLLVIVFHLDVAGVAIATIISQLISAILITRKLHKMKGDFHLSFSQICLKRDKVKRILQLGVPSGLQNSVFNLAGLTIQGSVNSLGTIVIAGNSAAQSIHSFAFQTMNAFGQGCMTFAGQNYGAKKYNRLNKIFRSALICQFTLGLCIAVLALVAAPTLLRIYLPNAADAIAAGVVALQMMLMFCFLSGMQDSASNMLRGMNLSVLPMIITIIGNCVLRVGWTLTVFPWAKARFDILTTFRWLMAAYPVTWAFTAAVELIIYAVVMKNKECA